MAQAPNDLEEALNALAVEGGVTHYLIINSEGVPIRWNGWGKQKEDLEEITQTAAHCMNYAAKCKKTIKTLLEPGENGVETFRMRTLKNEIIVAPGKDCTLLIMQKQVEELPLATLAVAAVEEVKA